MDPGYSDFIALGKGLLSRYNPIMRAMKKKSTEVRPKKKRGRPATGKDPLMALRAPPELIQDVKVWARRNEITFSEAARRLLEHGLSGQQA